MALEKLPTRYYVVFLHEDKYQYYRAEDIYEAEQKFEYYRQQSDVVILGIYDPEDWQFHWAEDPALQEKHYAEVYELTKGLRNDDE